MRIWPRCCPIARSYNQVTPPPPPVPSLLPLSLVWSPPSHTSSSRLSKLSSRSSCISSSTPSTPPCIGLINSHCCRRCCCRTWDGGRGLPPSPSPPPCPSPTPLPPPFPPLLQFHCRRQGGPRIENIGRPRDSSIESGSGSGSRYWPPAVAIVVSVSIVACNVVVTLFPYIYAYRTAYFFNGSAKANIEYQLLCLKANITTTRTILKLSSSHANIFTQDCYLL